MCRLFGFRSTIQSQVHRSLIEAEGAIGKLSGMHPDGWGVAYYVDGTPHVTRSPTSALGDALFHRVSGVVASETVIAHVRKATHGVVNVLNCHPFQYGRWTFAHNGNVPSFTAEKERLIAEIAPRLRRYVLGETDSEVVFFLFLTHLSRLGALSNRFGIDEVVEALRDATTLVREACDGPSEDEQSTLTFLVTDGATMAGVQGGKELYWSTYKTACSDRDSCPNHAPECEAPTVSGFVNHLIFTSEPIRSENVWTPMEPGDVIGVDWRMRLARSHLTRRRLSVAI
jgi:glutamine amidotransferase